MAIGLDAKIIFLDFHGLVFLSRVQAHEVSRSKGVLRPKYVCGFGRGQGFVDDSSSSSSSSSSCCCFPEILTGRSDRKADMNNTHHQCQPATAHTYVRLYLVSHICASQLVMNDRSRRGCQSNGHKCPLYMLLLRFRFFIILPLEVLEWMHVHSPSNGHSRRPAGCGSWFRVGKVA